MILKSGSKWGRGRKTRPKNEAVAQLKQVIATSSKANVLDFGSIDLST